MNELIKVESRSIGGKSIQTINARELHQFLNVATRFNDWIGSRIEQYGFIPNQDFVTFTENPVKGRPIIEYTITLDMAKELSMVERNEKGKQARRYFIECERQLLAKPSVPALPRPSDDLPSALRSAINRRAWTLSHAAYEEYRQRMLKDKMILSGRQHPEDWKPLETRQDALEHVEGMASLLETYSNVIRERGRRLPS
ncbi:phage anti-repressor protein [Nitrosospira multiformis]|uniref:Phage anti-repressor protein n=1 Tax=Nitrosospira multiformis TaxID=1231 RepID=A0A2T5IA71_9PROT|nr:antA/AntB antirepressor family protein [Nitrosospira multiformis]PTQ80729.1 phage anti-repressor protein [Nitrosospira multiformis]